MLRGYGPVVFLLLVAICACARGQESEKEYHPYDGWYNNRAHPEWGIIDSPLTRRVPSHYRDGVYDPSGWNRPNPREISEATMKGATGEGSRSMRTALLVFFGQQVVEEILDAQRPGCPPEYFNIKIPANDSLYDPDNTGEVEIPLLRSRYDQSISGFSPNFPRQQLNEITAFIDGGLTYGVSKAWADALRLHKRVCPERTNTSNILASQSNPTDCRGELASYLDKGSFPIENDIGLPIVNPPPPRDHVLKSAKRFYRIGNPRGNENPFLLTFGVLWFRYHNWWARRLREEHTDWSDEKVYNEARVRNIATHQKIVLKDWLPLFLGSCNRSNPNVMCFDIPAYDGYKSAIHPGVTHIFQSAAMRIGHTLVPPGVFRRTTVREGCRFLTNTLATAGDRHEFQMKHVNKTGLRTCNTYFNAVEAVNETDIDTLLMGMASQLCEREDNIITPDLRGSVFGFLEFSRRDLMAINIQRGRDHGLPDYNTARKSYGFPARTSFYDVNPALFTEKPELLQSFMRVHDNDISLVDVWTGGLLETTDSGPGELFREVIRDQFVRIRDGDRFWYENTGNGLLNATEIEEINNTTIREVILRSNPRMRGEDIQNNPFLWNNGIGTAENQNCPQPYQLNETQMEECTPPEKFDYFWGSELSFALTFACIGLFIILTLLFMLMLGNMAKKRNIRLKKRAATKKRSTEMGQNCDIANEIIGSNSFREVQIQLGPRDNITTKTVTGRGLRVIDTGKVETATIYRSYNKGRTAMFLRIEKETHDVVLSFNDSDERDSFVLRVQNFFKERNKSCQVVEVGHKQLMEQALTKEIRDRQLKKFFTAALAATVHMESSGDANSAMKEARKFIHVELSKKEFAEYLKMKPDSMFVDQMFNIADNDNSGAISFREFLDIMVLFTKGSPDEKARLMFDMYDLDKSGELSQEEFKTMLRSMMDMVNASVGKEEINELVNTMMAQVGGKGQKGLTLDDFQNLMQNYSSELSDASLHMPVYGPIDIQRGGVGEKERVNTVMHSATPVRETKINKARNTIKLYASKAQNKRESIKSQIQIKVFKKNQATNVIDQTLNTIERYTQNYRLQIFWLTLYLLVLAGIFVERAYYYSVEREHVGLRRIAGYGVSITRGAASAMMFTYSCLLVTMSRNTITALRETFLHRYIPFDSAITMHRIIAWLALFFTVMHILGHSMNIYSISTQTPGDLNCLFRDYWRTSDTLPKFHYWCWQTITGITGVILTLTVIIMYMFASDYSRRVLFKWFWWTHNFGYVILYTFMVLHGSGFLVQDPFFYYFFLGPAVLYTLDKLYSLSRSKTEISVVKAELLPSDVTHLEFKRPTNFDYRAGQWVRIACLSQSPSEYHPFTLTSAPHEETLKLHIRAVGPWTTNLRNIYNPEVLRDSPYPKIYLDGPFGEGHQDWYKYDVSVLVGGGIGVTPFASILKDLINVAESGLKIQCRRVYFMWITRDQKQYEWLTDIIQEVEGKDKMGILDTHIFITQFPQKFDLRTTMLYICERHFQKVAGKSLFTGLRAVTHFGRPDFKSFFASLEDEHSQVDKFGVFSCGPPPMTTAVEKTCAYLNKYDGATFQHHFENF